MEESLGQFYLCVHSLGRLFTTIQETLTPCMHVGTMAQIGNWQKFVNFMWSIWKCWQNRMLLPYSEGPLMENPESTPQIPIKRL